jgi:competence protein ComEC
MELTFLDVGQGDCMFASVQGVNFLVDCGSSNVDGVAKYRLIPFLKWKGVARIDYIFVTHGDDDHTNGVTEFIEIAKKNGITIKTVVVRENWKESSGQLKKIVQLCDSNQINVVYMNKGQQLKWKNTIITCLNPRRELNTEEENDRSLVLHMQVGQFRALFTGDIEMEGEKEILASISHVDVIKVAHHGSKGASSEQLLQILSPCEAIISAGKKNRYGHPNIETVSRIQKVNSHIYTTIKYGAISIAGDGSTYHVSTWK